MLAVVLVGIIGASHGQKPAAADVRPASRKVEAPKLAAVQEKIAEAPKADEITEEREKSTDVALIKGDLVAMPSREGWRYIQIEEADGRNYLLTLWYNAPLVTQARAEQDTKDIARVVLKSLMKAGRNPIEMKLRLSVTAKKIVAGETTAKGAVRYGYAMYDFIDDSLVYKQCGKGWLDC